MPVSILPGASAVALTSNLSTQTTSRPISFTATVSPSVSFGVLDGTVTFFDGSTPIGTEIVDSSGQATLTIATLPAGNDAIEAVYSGGIDFSSAVSNTVTVPIIQAPVAITTLSSSAGFVPTGSAYSLTVIVLPIPTPNATSIGGHTPTGVVTIYEDGHFFDTALLNSFGQAVFSYIATGPTSIHTFTANYSGDSIYSPSALQFHQRNPQRDGWPARRLHCLGHIKFHHQHARRSLQ